MFGIFFLVPESPNDPVDIYMSVSKQVIINVKRLIWTGGVDKQYSYGIKVRNLYVFKI